MGINKLLVNGKIGGCGQKPGLAIEQEVVMYSIQDRQKAIDLYIKYDNCAAKTIKVLGYLIVRCWLDSIKSICSLIVYM